MVAQPSHVQRGRRKKKGAEGRWMDGGGGSEGGGGTPKVFTLQLFLFELLAKQAEQEAVQILVIPER